jgi:hypothetical protein
MILGDGTEVRMGNTYGQGEVGDERGSKEMDRCPLTTTASSSRASTAACSQPSTSSQGPSRCATVEESDDGNDNEPGHVGDSLDPDGDTIMELSSDEEVEDDESELSKAANI